MSIPYNTIQKVRRFLTALDIPPSADADAGEVLALLTQSVRRHRNDPALRAELTKLTDDLQSDNQLGADNLSVPEVETVDASALARELEKLASAPPVAGPLGKQRRFAAMMVLACLLLGLALFSGCTQHNANNVTVPVVSCEEDISLTHFVNLVDRSDEVTPALRREAIREFQALNTAEQEQIIAALCRMSAQDIVDCLERHFAGFPHDNEAVDAQPLYKGVDF